jgi:serine/threonine-protein kinase SRK2
MAAAVAERWESALQRGGFFMTETEARFYFRQFVDAVAYMHQQQVAHR